MTWESIGAGSPLRPYQERAVHALVRALGPDLPGRACLIAPPGAGKTRCALHVAAALERPVVVLAPTTALVDQWRDRVRSTLVCLEEGEAPVSVHTYAGPPARFPHRALVILDEAHHLCGAWGREVEERLDPSHRVLGLTGTPPVDHPGRDRYLRLVGHDPVLVETPPLVRGGWLSPYQDLVWPVLADADDTRQLRQAEAALDRVEEELAQELSAWVSLQLTEHLWELTEARFARQEGLLVALCRHQHAQGRHLPADLPRDPELLATPTLADRARLLWAMDQDRPMIRTAVKEVGFRPAGRGLTVARDVAGQVLGSSRTRLRGCVEVLLAEQRARTDGIRALVVTERDTEGGRLSAREVLRALVTDPRTDTLDPILVTGSVVWVDDDLWPRVRERFPELSWREEAGYQALDVSTWPTGERTSLASALLAEGLTRCLVGTRHLLGEGWDCPAVNVLVDLTGVAARVTVNQVRGRALRLDPADPSKVASLWDIAVLAPGIPGGERMLDRLHQAFDHTLGLDPWGRIRTGLSRVDPGLVGTVEEVAVQVPDIRERMMARVRDPSRIAHQWSVGRGYEDRRRWLVEAPAPSPQARPALTAARPHKPSPRTSTALVSLRRRSLTRAVGAGVLALVLATTGAGAVVAALVLSTLWVGLAGGAALLTALPALGASGLLTRRWHGLRDRRPNLMSALAQAMEPLLDGGELRMDGAEVWVEGTEAASQRFAQAASELLGPVRYPRYLLLEPDGRAWPVPADLGHSRELADDLGAAWTERVGPCEVLWARQGRGRELLVEAWRAGGGSEVEVLETWS